MSALGQKRPLKYMQILASEWLVLGKAATRHSMPPAAAAFGQKQELGPGQICHDDGHNLDTNQ
jgi:hypothetical protein